MKFREEKHLSFEESLSLINSLTEVLDVFDVTLILCKGKFIYISYLVNFEHELCISVQYRYWADMVFSVRCGMYSSLIIIQW